MAPDDPLLTAYRVIRRLDSPADTPWPGLLAQDASGPVLLVDVPDLGENWPAWRAAADGHLLAPFDLVRRAQGHFAAFRPCGERLADFLARRSDAALTDGECLTLAVSGLRGLAETRTLQADDAIGTWWLSSDGRPVFAFRSEGEHVGEATRVLLEEVTAAASSRLAAVLAEAIEVAEEPARLARSLTRLEDAMFAVAAPEPLATTVFAPRRARAAAAVDPVAHDVPASEPSLLSRLVGMVDADLADALSRATTGLWRRVRAERPPSRRRPILVGGIIACAVLAGGLLWPAGGPATAEGGTADPTPAPGASSVSDEPAAADRAAVADPAAGVDAEATAGPPVSPPAGLEATLDALLTARASCDDACRAALQEDPSAVLAAGVVDLPATERRITLLDEFGGAAVLRVDAVAGEAASQLVVIVRTDTSWVLRDVHDVVEHPR
ncbi:hypothetical protein [Microbacterium sp. BK668]|uniref:hypothetical protein n=1 Tax=Microbacterium sp. BK668 TaxID=2512118 RepID=UPI00105E8658|nr:hypothetical protein [Microbacterium sp. BK668]TDN92874.1 hypothetical protein EV279_2411 [Microbacterium sp. BK668]